MSDDTETNVPSIPAIAGGEGNTKSILSAIKELLEVRDGRRGKKEDRFVTLRELAKAGIAQIGNIGSNGKAELLPGDGGVDYSTPPALSNLKAIGGYAQIFLQWDAPEYASFSHAEVWRSATSSVGAAEFIGETTASLYSDSCGTSKAFYYWVRAVSKAGVKGPFNAVDGTHAKTSDDIDYIISQLTGNATVYQPFYSVAERFLLPDGITWVEPGLYIKDARIANGAIGNAMIGTASIDDAKIANLSAAKVKFGEMHGDRIEVDTLDGNRLIAETLAAKFATIETAYIHNGNIENAALSFAKITNDIQSSNYSFGKTGWMIDKDGSMEMNDATFRGTIDVKSSATGARMEIKNNTIKVYDDAGVVRVLIGDLTQ